MSAWLTAPLALITYYHRDADPSSCISRKCVFTKAMLTRVQILVYRHLIDNAHSTMELYRKPIDKSILFYLFLVFLMLLVPALLSFLFFFFRGNFRDEFNWWKECIFHFFQILICCSNIISILKISFYFYSRHRKFKFIKKLFEKSEIE